MDFFNWNHGSDLLLLKPSYREQTYSAHRAPTSRWAGRSTCVLTWEGVLFRRQDDLITLLALLILEKQKTVKTTRSVWKITRSSWAVVYLWNGIHFIRAQTVPRETTQEIPVWPFPKPPLWREHTSCWKPAGNGQGWVTAPIPKWGLDYFLPCANLGWGGQDVEK